MLKVLIASRNEADNSLLEKKLGGIANMVGDTSFFSARPANLTTVLDGQYNLLVYNCQHFNSSMREHINQWRSVGYLGPIMVLAKVPDLRVIQQFSDLLNVTIVEKPYENKDLQGIAVKYLNDAIVAQRKFRRFDTEQIAILESYTKDYSSQTKIQNISKGGAQVIGDLDNMSKGDLLRVSFQLDEIKKSHTMSAEVVWTKGDVGTERAAGIQFVSKEKVYESLLSAI